MNKKEEMVVDNCNVAEDFFSKLQIDLCLNCNHVTMQQKGFIDDRHNSLHFVTYHPTSSNMEAFRCLTCGKVFKERIEHRMEEVVVD